MKQIIKCIVLLLILFSISCKDKNGLRNTDDNQKVPIMTFVSNKHNFGTIKKEVKLLFYLGLQIQEQQI